MFYVWCLKNNGHQIFKCWDIFAVFPLSKFLATPLISLQVIYLTQVCEGEKQSQFLSITSLLWFWRRIRLVVHFRDKFLSFLCCGTSCFKNDFSSQCQKETIGWPEGLETDIVASSDSVSHKRMAWGCRGCGHIPNAENLAIIRAKIFNIWAKYTATITCKWSSVCFPSKAK